MWLLSLPVVAFLLLGAHFLRSGHWSLVAGALLMIGLLAIPSAWAAHLARLALFLGALTWLRALVSMAAMRYSMDLPFVRLTLILGAVLLLTGAAIFVFSHPRLRRFYGLCDA